MKLMKTTEAVGQVLCHDMTQIIPDVTKDAVFRKGHIVREEDIPVLLSIGKDHIYVWEKDDTMLHETIQNIMRTRRRIFCAASARMSICVQPIRRKARLS